MRFRDFKLKGSARTGVAFKYPSRQSKSYNTITVHLKSSLRFYRPSSYTERCITYRYMRVDITLSYTG
jgi:hypothetical protein